MINIRKRALNTATAVLLAFSLTAVGAPVIVGSLPSMAQAAEQEDITDGSIVISQGEVTMTAGTQLDLEATRTVDPKPIPEEAIQNVDWHMNYGISKDDAGIATVNKRSGIVTANAPGTVTVEVYMMSGEAITGTQDFPDAPDDVLDHQTFQLVVKAASVDTGAYVADETLQGLAQAVTLQNYVNDGATYTIERSGDAITQYTNKLGVIAKANEALSFKYRQAFGVGSNFDQPSTDPEKMSFLQKNAGKIMLVNGDNETIASLGNGLTLALQPGSKQAFDLTVDNASLASGSYSLVFASDYVAGNGRDMLGVDVVFNFCIEEVA